METLRLELQCLGIEGEQPQHEHRREQSQQRELAGLGGDDGRRHPGRVKKCKVQPLLIIILPCQQVLNTNAIIMPVQLSL